MKRGSNGILSGIDFAYNGESVSGGALTIASASLKAFDCVFSNNAAFGGAAGTNQSPVTHFESLGGSASGGAIYAYSSSLNLSNCLFNGNSAAGGLGGPPATGLTRLPANSLGGAIYVDGGELLLARCSFANNRAAERGGGGALWCQATNLQVTDGQFTMNTAQMGGAILDSGTRSSISNSSFTANAAVGAPYNRNYASLAPAYGGAYHHVAGTAALDGCAFTLNNATGADAGQGSFDTWWASSGFGGALAHVGGNLALAHTLLASNWTRGGGGGPVAIGGIRSLGDGLGGAAYLTAVSTITNCTFAVNRAIGGQNGNPGYGRGVGGALSMEGGAVALHFCTIANNSAEGVPDFASSIPRGGGIAQSNGTVTIGNSIFSQNKTNAGFENFSGAFTDLGHNISSDATAWTSGTSLNNTDPLLLPLANNGGPTLTMALGAGSPALDSADCATAPPTDQRGYPRPSGAGCDIGAYEASAPLGPYIHIFRESSSTNVLRWLGEAGRSYRVDGSVNLSNWTAIATNIANTNGWLDYRVPANPSPRFFRLHVQ